MELMRPAGLALALLAACPLTAGAQSLDELRRELKALKEQVKALERKLDQKLAAPVENPAEKQWGMTPAQLQDFNRIALKAEALEDGQESMGWRGLKISGQMDPSFIYNRAQRRAGFQFLNAVGDDGYRYDNSYFGIAMVDFQKELEGGTRWRLALAPNRGAGAVFDGQSIVHEASVSLPLGDLQTRLIAGQVPDWSGYEYLQPTLNKLVTHNLLFDFTLPTAYTGAGIELHRGKWLTKAMVANMNASRRQARETAPVFAYRVDYARGEYQGFGLAGVHGKGANPRDDILDGNGDPVPQRDSTLHLFEADAYFIRGDWTLQGQLSHGRQAGTAITLDPATGAARDARWWGASALAAYKFTPRLEGIARADYLNNGKNGGGLLGYTARDDRNGIGPDPAGDAEAGADRVALSLGMGYLVTLNTTFKAEYRFDHASQAVFVDVKNGAYRKRNHLLGASMVVSF